MTNDAKLYDALYEHIQAFDQTFGPDADDDWDEFIADIKKRVAFKYMDAHQKHEIQSPGSQ